MKEVLISTRPKWCEKICHEIGKDENGKPIYEKTIEVRKTKPSIPTPFKVCIYCTLDGGVKGDYQIQSGIRLGYVIGEFICDKVEEISCLSFVEKGYEIDTHLTYKEFHQYGKGKPLYGWHISDLKIYDKPKELSEFVTAREKDNCDACGIAWQSWNGDFHCTLKHCDGYHLSRAPQGWMYVEELEV